MTEAYSIEKVRELLKSEMNKRFKVKHYRLMCEEVLAEIKLMVPGGEIELSIADWDGGETCSVKYSFTWLRDDKESYLTELYKMCIILKDLFVITREYPTLDITDNAEYIIMEIEYMVNQYKIESIMYIVEAFSRIDLTQRNIDKTFIEMRYLALYRILVRKSDEAKIVLKEYMEFEQRRKLNYEYSSIFRPLISNIFSSQDYVYTNYNQKILIGFTQEGIENYIVKHQLILRELPNYYEGVDYNIVEIFGDTLIWDKKLWIEASNWLHALEMHYNDVPIYRAYAKNRIFIRVIEFWICIMTEVNQVKDKIVQEKKYIQSMQRNFLEHTNDKTLKMDYDLNNLTPDEFEDMCCELLYADDFKYVYKRGKLNATDGEVDIEAVEVTKGKISGEEEKKWIFQCKKTKKSINRKDFNEIPFLLDTFKADRYGLFYSGILQPSALDRCRSFDKNTIWIFDENVIKQKLKEHKNIAHKYFPLYKL